MNASPSGSLRGRVALVTGAARSLGADIARQLAREGAHVIVNYFHSVEQAGLLRAELQAAGLSCEFIRASVAKTGEVDRMFDEIRERHGGLDILVNNAAGGAFLPLLEIDDTYWERAWRTNVMAVYHCSRRAAELMAGRPGASILCLSSVGSQLPVPGYGPGGVTKAAAESLVRYLALDLAPQDIRVNTILLGSVASEIVSTLENPEAVMDPASGNDLLNRTISTPEAARLICHFLGAEAGFITGQTIVADGGIGIAGMQALRLHSNLAAQAVRPGRSRAEPARPARLETSVRGETAEPRAVAEKRSVTGPASPGPDCIAVVGLGVVLPGASDREELWERLRDGVFQASEPAGFPLEHFWSPDPRAPDRFHVREAAYLKDFTPVPGAVTEPDGDPAHPGIPRTARWLRHCAVQALEGLRSRDTDRWLAVTTGAHDQTGIGQEAVVLGEEYQQLLREATSHDEDGEWLAELARHAVSAYYGGAGVDPLNILPASVSRLALRGLAPEGTRHVVLDAACASGLYVLDTAVKALREGSCDVALAAGTSVIEPTLLSLFCQAQGITVSGLIKPFDQAADGTLLGEGAVALALKTHTRALADGDSILGLVLGTGLAADGKGKGIHAPAERGQELAIGRAWDDAGIRPGDLDWIVAHGTGTPAGDTVELRALLSKLGGPEERTTQPCLLTSNKQVFGHTGVLAGLVSVAHALVALEHQAIPAHASQLTPHSLLSGDAAVTVPVRQSQWAAGNQRPRVVGVSSFGLGGADAHAVLSDLPPASPPARQPQEDGDLVLVGWNTHLPGMDSSQVAAWLSGRGTAPDAVFGETYPIPSPREVRIPPRTMGHMDQTHLMMIQAVHPLLDQLGAAAAKLKPTMAVLVGTAMPSAHATRMGLRVHAAECAATFGILPDPIQAQRLEEHLAKAVEAYVPDISEDDFTGAVSCIASGRVTNYDDLQGFGVTVYAHRDSAHAALDVALRQLRHGACDLALVGAVSTAPLRGWKDHLVGMVPGGRTVAEGAAVLSVARRSTAVSHGLPILGVLSTTDDSARDQDSRGHDALSQDACAIPALEETGRSYLALDAVLAVLRGLVTGTDTVVRPSGPGAPPIRLTVATPDGGKAARTEEAHGGEQDEDLGQRQTVRLVPLSVPSEYDSPGEGDERQAAIPPGSIVITDSADLAAASAAAGCACWSPMPGVPGTTFVLPEDAARALGDLPFIPRHLRVLHRLAAPLGQVDDEAQVTRAEIAHDLVFTAAQAILPALRRGGTLSAVLLDALPGGMPHPLSGLFTGLIRSVRAEIPQAEGIALLTDTGSGAVALRHLAQASGQRDPLHTIIRRGGDWLRLIIADDDAAEGRHPLPPGAVVVAFGGARGITPELLHAIARSAVRPTLYLVGRTPLPDRPLTELPAQAEFIAAEHREHPDLSLGELKARYERLQRSREVHRTVERLERLCGTGNVHHRVCDILDEQGTAGFLGEILERHGHIDLLINAVLDLRPRALDAKTLDDFRQVRATKAVGYRNLKRALTASPPRVWVNFSTLATVAPAPGDTDYASANEYLQYCTWASPGEISILWSGWKEVGVASSAAMEETLKRNDMDAYITPAQGCAQFLSVLARPPASGLAFFVREPERAMLARRGIVTDGKPVPVPVPDAPPPAPADPALRSPLIDGVLMQGRDWTVLTKTWKQDSLTSRDGQWLLHHQVNGAAVLPGTFALEAAAVAAARLRPGLAVTGFRDLMCHASVTVSSVGQPRTMTVEARVNGEDEDGAVAAVRIFTDRVSRNGKVLRFNDLCYEVSVVLGRRYPRLGPPPEFGPHEPHPAFAMPIYSRSDDSPIFLSGPFAGTSEYGRGPDGTSARFTLDHAAWAPALSDMTVPSLLLDALAHLLLLPAQEGMAMPAIGPMAGIAMADLGAGGNDCSLNAAHPRILLHRDLTTETLTAVGGDGQVLARVSGVTAHYSSASA
jgi:NAD(P)-dependent dehydrogenase (short-subunit alcohol dehydrogenase family)/3-oxoacyl-(acyl-carrier-protein) synthase